MDAGKHKKVRLQEQKIEAAMDRTVTDATGRTVKKPGAIMHEGKAFRIVGSTNLSGPLVPDANGKLPPVAHSKSPDLIEVRASKGTKPKVSGRLLSVVDVYSNYQLFRDIAISMSGIERGGGVVTLEDEHGKYILRPLDTFFDFYNKTYISGKLAGETQKLGFFDSRRETIKLNEKYGYFDWKGEFVQGKFPPLPSDPYFQ